MLGSSVDESLALTLGLRGCVQNESTSDSESLSELEVIVQTEYKQKQPQQTEAQCSQLFTASLGVTTSPTMEKPY